MWVCQNPASIPLIPTQAGVPLGSVRVSDILYISVGNTPVPVSVTGGDYSIGCTGVFTNATGTIQDGQTICLRQTASSNYDTMTAVVLTVGPTVGHFRVITTVAPGFTVTPQVAGGGFTLAAGLRSDGSLFEWGNSTPALRADVSGVTRISTGGEGFFLALRSPRK